MSGLSVVLPNFNHARFLPAALEGVLSQSRPADEVLVIDDASTDDSVSVVESFRSRHPSVRLLRNERNLGPLASINRGLAEARGELAVFCAADDVALPGLFEKSAALLERHPSAALCSSLSRLIDEDGRDLGLFPSDAVRRESGYLTPAECLDALRRRDTWIMGNTCVYRRSALVAEGGFPAELRSFADGFLCRLLALKHGACFIPEPLAAWRRMEGGFAGAAADPAVGLPIRDRAAALMRSRYRDLFPEDYVRSWERRWTRDLLSHLVAHQGAELAAVSKSLPGAMPLDRAVLAAMRGLRGLENLGLRALHFGRRVGLPL